MEIRALQPTDPRSTFRSGDPDLDRFFQKYSAQNQFRHHIGATYVAVEDDHVMGYATVAPGQIEIDNLPASARTSLPRYPLPVLRLARLAVDQSAQGRGVGSKLLAHVLTLALRLAGEFGCVGVVVDAKPSAVPFYARFGFVAFPMEEGMSGSRPVPTAMFLSLSKIRAAG